MSQFFRNVSGSSLLCKGFRKAVEKSCLKTFLNCLTVLLLTVCILFVAYVNNLFLLGNLFSLVNFFSLTISYHSRISVHLQVSYQIYFHSSILFCALVSSPIFLHLIFCARLIVFILSSFYFCSSMFFKCIWSPLRFCNCLQIFLWSFWSFILLIRVIYITLPTIKTYNSFFDFSSISFQTFLDNDLNRFVGLSDCICRFCLVILCCLLTSFCLYQSLCLYQSFCLTNRSAYANYFIS